MLGEDFFLKSRESFNNFLHGFLLLYRPDKLAHSGPRMRVDGLSLQVQREKFRSSDAWFPMRREGADAKTLH
jgi:hypothetical protein